MAKWHRAVALVSCLLAAGGASRAETTGGQVELPLDQYNQMYDATKTRPETPKQAPTGHSLGTAVVRVTIEEHQSRATAHVEVALAVELLEDDWQLVPVLPSGTSVKKATSDNAPISLVQSAAGLCWATHGKIGKAVLNLAYDVDATRSDQGYSAGIPVPAAATNTLTATLPGTGLDVAVVPGAGMTLTTRGDTTVVTATYPATSAIQVIWRAAAREGHTVSRASYTGTLAGDAVRWTSKLEVDIFSSDTITLDLLPRSTTLGNVVVDRENAPIVVHGDYFATLVAGRGTHTVEVTFETPVAKGAGPPSVTVPLPQVPVSRFELSLPGKKDLAVVPATSVTRDERGGRSVLSFLLPMAERVNLSWKEAVPEEIRTEVRANASLYHTAHVEEGVLYVSAIVVFDVTRGETNTLALSVPPSIQVNRVHAPEGGVADWRIARTSAGGPGTATVFLDRKISGELVIDVEYEQLIGTGEQAEAPFRIPCLRALGVHRQRGMIALLSSKELALKPTGEQGVTRVGENQLPAFVREAIDMTVAHTYKYLEDEPVLSVVVTRPERKAGRFDAQVDTLVSLGDVTMDGVATVDVNVKSGSIDALQLTLPKEVNVLAVTAPSLRAHKVIPGEKEQTIDVQFTQEMEGQFRLECTYERILSEGQPEVDVPLLAVEGAEVEQGRIAVEALSAVEIRPSSAGQLTSLDVDDLPRRLILKTTNPILEAYKYVRGVPPPNLVLKVTRHKEVSTQDAVIDEAHYATLFTRDGLAVTAARFLVRNSRKQFLRIRLPEGSEIWSVAVNGKSEKPAVEGGGEKGGAAGDPIYLVKIITSSDGFPVDLVYATPVRVLGSIGTLRGSLPVPEILVTRTRWDVYLPDRLEYQEPESNMELVQDRYYVTRDRMATELAALDKDMARGSSVRPLATLVPTGSVKLAFEKLYANRSDDVAEFQVAYASSRGMDVATWLSALAVLLFWGVLVSRLFRPTFLPPRAWSRPAVGAAVVAGAAAVAAMTFLGVSTLWPGVVSAVAVAAIGLVFLARTVLRRRFRRDRGGGPGSKDKTTVESGGGSGTNGPAGGMSGSDSRGEDLGSGEKDHGGHGDGEQP